MRSNTSCEMAPEILSRAMLRCTQSIAQQHRNCHRPHTARHWRNRRCHLHRRCEIHVTHELAIGQAIDANIDHHRTWLEHIAIDHAGLADCRDENIGVSGEP